jgi:hypothetical protein
LRPITARAGSTLLVACAALAILVPSAPAASRLDRKATRLSAVSDKIVAPGARSPFSFASALDNPLLGHLPPTQQAVELVGRLDLISPSTGLPILDGQIADVAVHKGYAYLNSWDSPTCDDGGTFVVDIRDPAHPVQVAFIPAQAPFYHGEGAHVVSIDTPQFKGDLLAVNDETYGSNLTLTDPGCAPADKTGGGFDLYDVTDPANPVPLVQGAGDRSPEGSEVQDPGEVGKSYHSVFVWQDGPRAYLVASDNTELADVDIFDITDPTDPEFIKDLDVLSLPEAAQIVSNGAHGNAIFHHDVVVKRFDDHMRMLVSYWDAGYVQLNVDDPSDPTYITDTNFDDPDPLTGADPPEGNAHEAEYSHDNEFFLAGDEDFDAYRPLSEITEAPYAGYDMAAALSSAEPLVPGENVAGDTVFVGSACTGTVAPPPPGVTIAVAERGVCAGGFQEKADAIEDAGYELGVIMNNSFGAGGGRCESLINMLIDPATVDIPMIFVGRADGLRVLNAFDAGTYACTGAAAEEPADTDVPAVGSPGLTVEFGSQFDGWGYAHLYDAQTSEELDAFAITEGVDERYATGFGDLTIHELATDPATNLAYASYYAGGMRVLRFSRADGLEEVGRFIDEGGSNLWGVEQLTDKDGNRLIAVSDRDKGLLILKYTGPGAVLAPPPPGPPAPPAPPAPPTPPASPTGGSGTTVKPPSTMFTFGALKRLVIRTGQANAMISVPGAGQATATVRVGIGRRVVELAKVTRTATAAGPLRLTFRVSAATLQQLRGTLARRPSHRVLGVLQVSFTRDGNRRTRNKALSISIGR